MIRNPGRGWYEIHTFRSWEAGSVERALESADSLALVRVQIGAGGEELAQSEIDRIDQILGIFSGRQDIILRLAYDLEGRGLESEPGLFCQVEHHLEQLAPVLRKFASSIYVYQGMLVGSWGEMHTSKFVTKRHLSKLGQQLIDTSGGQFFLAVRRPSQWRQLIREDKFDCRQQTAVGDVAGMVEKCAGIGLFNDGILGSETDLGTYGSETAAVAGWEAAWLPQEEVVFQKSLCRFVPNGGEAVYGSSTKQQTLEQVVERLSDMHISYLNRYHDERVLSYWRELKWDKPGVWKGVNGFDYIGCHLGYRFVVRQADMLFRRGEENAVLKVTIENVGFSCMYEQAELFVEYESGEGGLGREQIPCDVTGWGSGETVSISHRVPICEGCYYLSMRRVKDHRVIVFANRQVETREERVLLGRLFVR